MGLYAMILVFLMLSFKPTFSLSSFTFIKKQQLELDMEQWTVSRLGKEYVKAVLSPCLFNLYAEYIM